MLNGIDDSIIYKFFSNKDKKKKVKISTIFPTLLKKKK